MRFFVTGATGFVGGATTRRLIRDGHDVVAYVRDEGRASDEWRAGAEIRVGSIGDPNAMAEAAEGCDVVIHCAAASHVDADPRALRWVNVAGTENVLNAAKHAGCRRMIHLSCADVTLADADHVNWNESQELLGLPLGNHARSKALGEEIALSGSTADFGVVALRPAWVWGPGDDSRLPWLMNEALWKGIQLVGRGEALVAVTYIDNLVDAIVAAFQSDDAIGKAYYVADNEFISVREFLDAVATAVGTKKPRPGPGLVLARPIAAMRKLTGSDGLSWVDVVKRGRSITFDISQGQNDLGWEPEVGLEEGMKALAAWAKEVGGDAKIAAMARDPASAASVDEQVAAAGGD